MKQIKTNITRTKLRLTKETILKLLSTEQLRDVNGGQLHTSFSCGNDLCTTH